MKFLAFLFLLFSFRIFAQVPNQLEQLRIPIWAELDSFPGSFEDSDSQEKNSEEKKDESEFEKLYGTAIERAKLIAPFLMQGLLSGWTFDYTPYDKTRKVQEHWEFVETRPFDSSINKIEYHKPIVKDGNLLCWIYCNRTQSQQQEFKRWNSIEHDRIKGTGTGKVEDGFEGIKTACSNAAKSAVREYWRKLIKNKPKEISGSLLLVNNPRIYIKSGQYVVDLDFFLETDRIVPYTLY